MSDFFGKLNAGGIRLPEAKFNDGGMLPPLDTSGYKNGLDGTADARINAASTLLGDVKPYVYGTSDRLTTQTAYLNTPHNVQKIIPQIMLPDCAEASKEHTFLLPHAVSDGDIAFAMRFVTRKARDLFLSDVHTYVRQGAARAIDYICNITTVNYILRGLQIKPTNPAWEHFATALGSDVQNLHSQLKQLLTSPDSSKYAKEIKHLRSQLAKTVFRDICRPMGVVIGSDKQGGQHQGSNKAVTFPVDFVATVSVDGRNENLCNFWKCGDVNSGDALLLHLKEFKSSKLKNIYNLNNHKYSVRKEFMQGFEDSIFQICPITQTALFASKTCISVLQQGYWHFAMSQKMHRMRNDFENVTDIEQYHRGGLLQVTISPHFKRNVEDTDEFEHVNIVFATQAMVQQQVQIDHRPVFMQLDEKNKRKQQATNMIDSDLKPDQQVQVGSKRCKVTFMPQNLQSNAHSPVVSLLSYKPTTFTPRDTSASKSKTVFKPSTYTSTSMSTEKASVLKNVMVEDDHVFSANLRADINYVPFDAIGAILTGTEMDFEKVVDKNTNENVEKNTSEKKQKITATSEIAVSKASVTVLPPPVKGRIKATRLAADPSVADSPQKGNRL